MSDYKNVKVKQLEHSQVEITGEIFAEVVRDFEEKALGRLGADVEMSGFRKGKVPAKMVKEKVGEVRIWVECGELALQDAYPKIVREKQIQVIGVPEVTITKLAPGNPLGFKIVVAVMPEVRLPDYKKIAKDVLRGAKDEAKKVEVTDKEIEDLMLNLQKARARHEKTIQEKASKESESESGVSEGAILGADGKPIGKTQDSGKKKKDEPIEEALSEFDDAFAKSLGDFKDVEDFKRKARKNLEEDKKLRAKEKVRFDVVDKIVEALKMDLPEALVEGELARMMAQFEGDISRAGYAFKDYLKHAGKTEDDLRKEWRSQAEKRAKTQLVLLEIAKSEKLHPDKAKVEENVKKLMAQYKDADEGRARAYMEEVLLNEKVFEFLESL